MLGETHKAHSTADQRGEFIKNIYDRSEPFCKPIIIAPRLVKSWYLLSQHDEDSIGGIAGFESSEERIGFKVLPCFLSIGR